MNAYADVLHRVNHMVPFFIERSPLKKAPKTYGYYHGLMDRFLGVIQASDDLFEATMNVKQLRNQLMVGQVEAARKRVIEKAYDDIMDILKSTRKYYGVGLEKMFKHDMVLQ